MPDRVALLRSQTLQVAEFRHAFSTRAGGVSVAPFESLDFAILRDAGALRENQRRLGEAVGFDPGRLFQTRQVHGNVVAVAGGDPGEMLEREADALVAEAGSGNAVGVRVADCVPVLLAAPKTGAVAAVHAGWRGIVAGVIGAALGKLCPSGDSAGVLAAIGPCIGPCCFEVGEDVAETIARATSEGVITRREPARGKAFVDLRAAARAQLRARGLADSAIDDVPDRTRAGCTQCNAERFYSYRRDGDASGRLIAVIAAR